MDNILIINTIQQFRDKAIQVLPDIIDKIYLYGSCARGDFNNDSDIDLFVILNCSDDVVFSKELQLNHIASDVGINTDTLISCQTRTKTDWNNRFNTSPYFQNILKEGIVIYE